MQKNLFILLYLTARAGSFLDSSPAITGQKHGCDGYAATLDESQQWFFYMPLTIDSEKHGQPLITQLTALGMCPLILSVPRKYYLIHQEKTWDEAREYCQEHHTSLVTIRDNHDILNLQKVADHHGFSSHAWMGLYDEVNSWHWSFQNMPLGNVKYWKSGQPNNNERTILCVITHHEEWEDKPCDEAHGFVCFDDSKTDTEKYIGVSTEKTWHEAQSHCRKHHTDLARIRDDAEADFIEQEKPGGDTWIGLFRQTWRWIDQSNVSSIVWKNGQPDDSYPSKGCGVWKVGEVEDKPCSDKYFFFCHSEITGQKQIVRIEVRSKIVTDTEVKGAVLEKIEEKLRELRMAGNTTVTWREQPDGKVFHKQEVKKAIKSNHECEL